MSLAGVAHPVERHLAKVEVASSSLVTRSKEICESRSLFFCKKFPHRLAGGEEGSIGIYREQEATTL